MLMKKVHYLLAATLVGVAVFSTVWPPAAKAQQTAAAAQVLTAGEVRKVDLAQGKVTLKHEAIKNLDMAAMTMVFKASKPEQLKPLKAGDKVRFHAEADKAGALIVTHIEAAK